MRVVFPLLAGFFLLFSCGKKSETQTAAADNQFSPPAQTAPDRLQQMPSDTQPLISSQIPSQARGIVLPGKIVFWRNGQLYLMDGNGENQRRISTLVKDGYGKISWAPDAKRITFTARGRVYIQYPIRGEWNSYASDVFTTHIDSLTWYTQVSDNFGTSYPDWSRDGRVIWASVDLSANKFNNLFEPVYPNYQLFKANLGRDTFTTNIYSCPASGVVRAQALQPASSPDGKKLAFTVAVTNVQGLPEVVGMVILPAGEIRLGFQELLKEAEKIPKGYAPSWSPDGKEIAYVSTRNEGNQEIYIRNTATGAERLVLPSRPGFNINTTAPGWSPDGKWLCFSTFTGGIYVVGVDGKKMYQLSQTGSDLHPAWSPK
jgi:hypothetical protein